MSSTPLNPVSTTGANTNVPVTNPPAPKQNGFVHFFVAIGHGIEDVFKWGPSFGKKIELILERAKEEGQLEPQLIDGLKTFANDGAVLVASAGAAVGEKGLNPLQDIQTLEALETFVKSFSAFYPLVEEAIQIMEGKKVSSPVPVTDPGPQNVVDVINAATSAQAESKQVVSDVETSVQPLVNAIESEIKTFNPSNTTTTTLNTQTK